MSRLATIIPVNRLERAKGRLAALLSPDERRQLALTTLSTVVAAAVEAQLRPIILTAEPSLLASPPDGAERLAEVEGVEGLNPQLEAALWGRPAALVLHADLPLATAAALEALVASAPAEPSVTLVRSPDGGTNAMLLLPPGRFPLAYGRGSYALHLAAAREATLAVAEHASPALGLDLDTPADLAALLSTDEGRATAAGRYLVDAGIEARLRA